MALKSTEMIKELKISRSTFYYLLKNNLIPITTTETGRYVWDEGSLLSLKSRLQEKEESPIEEKPRFKTTQINNRRYLGNKYKLLKFIKGTIDRECQGVNTIADIFAGTGSVASAFIDKKIISNDLLYFNHICHIAWFGAEQYDEKKIESLICYYNAISPEEENYMSIHFSNTFFSAEDSKKIGFIREDIEIKYTTRKINARERAILITSLL